MYTVRGKTEITGPGLLFFCLEINKIAVKAPDRVQWAPVREVSNNTAVSTISQDGNFSFVLRELYAVLTSIEYI